MSFPKPHSAERARAVGTVHCPSSLQRLWNGQSGTQPSSAVMPVSAAVVLDAGSTGYLHCLYRRTRPASILDCGRSTACSTGIHMTPDKCAHSVTVTECAHLLSGMSIAPYSSVERPQSCVQICSVPSEYTHIALWSARSHARKHPSDETSKQPMLRWVSGARAAATLVGVTVMIGCLLYTSPSPRDRQKSRMPSSA